MPVMAAMAAISCATVVFLVAVPLEKVKVKTILSPPRCGMTVSENVIVDDSAIEPDKCASLRDLLRSRVCESGPLNAVGPRLSRSKRTDLSVPELETRWNHDLVWNSNIMMVGRFGHDQGVAQCRRYLSNDSGGFPVVYKPESNLRLFVRGIDNGAGTESPLNSGSGPIGGNSSEFSKEGAHVIAGKFHENVSAFQGWQSISAFSGGLSSNFSGAYRTSGNEPQGAGEKGDGQRRDSGDVISVFVNEPTSPVPQVRDGTREENIKGGAVFWGGVALLAVFVGWAMKRY